MNTPHPSHLTESSHATLPELPLRRRMSGRDIHETHRAASPLELLFDLTTVVAVAAAAGRLHHDISGGHYIEAIPDLLFSFFALWWSWMNFTWFSSAYDTDDIGYRIATGVQMIGMLLMTVGLHQGSEGQLTETLGYTVMRVAMVALWLRAAYEHLERRTTCQRYAIGLTAVQTLWLLRIAILPLLPSHWGFISFILLAAVELTIPIWAERAGGTPWHPHHIAERYSLLTIILLGECMVGAGNSMAGALETHGWSLNLIVASIAIVGLIVGLWWAYFLVPFAQVLHQQRDRGFLWGYGHALVFIALAALSGVLEVVADVLKMPVAHLTEAAEHSVTAPAAAHHGATPVIAIMFATAAVLLFLLMLWWLGARTTRRLERSFVYLLPSTLVAALAITAVHFGLSLPWGLLLLACSPAVLIAVVMRQRHLHPERFAVR